MLLFYPRKKKKALNYLNLPERVQKDGTNDYIEWLYDAGGQKLQKRVVNETTGTKNLDYYPVTSGTYQGDSIRSEGSVYSGNDVLFQAGQEITLQPGFRVDFGGNFLGKIGTSSTMSVSTKDYCNAIEYRDSTLEAIYISDGRLFFEDTIGNPRYEYNLTDH